MSYYSECQRGRKSIPKGILEARREYAVGLRSAGVKIPQIHRDINGLSMERGWGEISQRTLERDIAKYYQERILITPEDKGNFFALRRAHLEQMELTIEMISVYIMDKKDWKPFEYPKALERLNRMQMRYAELQNWNYTKKNMDFDFRHRSNDN